MTHRIAIATPHARYDAIADGLAQLHHFEVLRIRDKDALSVKALQDFGCQWVFFPHWSWIVPPEIHDSFRSVIFHMTDLPYGRGGSPLQNLIVNGHKTTKLTALKCESGLDTGPVYLKRDLTLTGTAEDIFGRAADLMPQMIREIVELDIEPIEQQGDPVIFKRRTPDQSAIDKAQSLDGVYDHIRMLDAEGYPNAFAETERYRIEFTAAESDENGNVFARARITPKADNA